MAVAHRLAVESRNDIAFFQAGLRSRRVLEDARHQDAVFAFFQAQARGQLRLANVLDLHAEIAATDDAVLEQLRHDVLGDVAGDSQADALPAARTTLDGGVNADDLAVQADQWTAAVAGVDGRVR